MGGKARKGRTKWRPVKLEEFFTETKEAEILQSTNSNEEPLDLQDSGSSVHEEGEEFQPAGPDPYDLPPSAGFYVDGLWIPWPPTADNAGYFPCPMGPPYWVPHDLPLPPPSPEEALHFYTPGPYIDEERELIIFPYYHFDPGPKFTRRRWKRSQFTNYEKQAPHDTVFIPPEEKIECHPFEIFFQENHDEVTIEAEIERPREEREEENSHTFLLKEEEDPDRNEPVGSFGKPPLASATTSDVKSIRRKALCELSIRGALDLPYPSCRVLEHLHRRVRESVFRRPKYRLKFGFASAESIEKWRHNVVEGRIPFFGSPTLISSTFNARNLCLLSSSSSSPFEVHLGNSFIIQDFKLEYCLTANHEIDLRKCLLAFNYFPKFPKPSPKGKRVKEEDFEIINSPSDPSSGSPYFQEGQPGNAQTNLLSFLDQVICQILNNLSKTSIYHFRGRQPFSYGEFLPNTTQCFSCPNSPSPSERLRDSLENGKTFPPKDYIILPRYAKLRRVFVRLLETAYKRKKRPVYKESLINLGRACESPCPFVKGQLVRDLKVLLKQGTKTENVSELARSVRRELGDLLAERAADRLTTSGGEMPGEVGADVTAERLPEDERLTHLERCVLCQAISSRRGDLIQWLDGFMVEAPQERSLSPEKAPSEREASPAGLMNEVSPANKCTPSNEEDECMDKKEAIDGAAEEARIKTISRFTVVRVSEDELTRHNLEDSSETKANTIPNERLTSLEEEEEEVPKRNGHSISSDEKDAKDSPLKQPYFDFAENPLPSCKPSSLPAVLRSPGDLQAKREERAKGSPLPYFSTSEALIRDTEMELNRLKYLEQKSLFQPQQYRLAFDSVTPEECPEGDIFPQGSLMEPTTVTDNHVMLSNQEESGATHSNGTSEIEGEMETLKEGLLATPPSSDHTQGSVFRLPSKGKCPYKDLTEPPPQESSFPGSNSSPAVSETRRQSLNGQREDEIHVHEADTDSEPGSEDMDLLGHTAIDRHLYTNRLCLAAELADARGGPAPPLDNQFKPLLPLDGLDDDPTSWRTVRESGPSEVATEVMEQLQEPKMNGTAHARPLQTRLRMTAGTPVPPYVCCTIM